MREILEAEIKVGAGGRGGVPAATLRLEFLRLGGFGRGGGGVLVIRGGCSTGLLWSLCMYAGNRTAC